MRYCNLIVVLLSTAAICCSDSATAPTLEVIPFQNVDFSERFLMPSAGTDVIREDSVWTTYWRLYWNSYESSGKKSPAPVVDFQKQVIVAVFYGYNYMGCSAKVSVIDRIESDGSTIKVILKPLPSMGPCSLEISPIQMVTIPRTGLPVIFEGVIPK